MKRRSNVRFKGDHRFTPRALAVMWGMSEGTLKNWRSLGRGPKYVKLGGSVRYKLSEIIRYEERRKRV